MAEYWKRGAKSLQVGDQTFEADDQGFVTVPDDLADSSIAQHGFVVAAPVRAALAAEAEKAAKVAAPAPSVKAGATGGSA